MNLDLITAVADGLGELSDRVVYVGGSVVNLLITDTGAPMIRETIDVDVVVELTTKREYRLFQKALRERGFKQDESPGAPICRWVIGSVPVDVIPPDASVIGFSSRWYPEAIMTADERELPDGRKIRCISPALFLATKFEAFNSRGAGDFQASHDMEDIVAVIDGRSVIVDDVENASDAARDFIADQCRILLALDAPDDVIAGHLLGDAASQARLPEVMKRLERIKALAD